MDRIDKCNITPSSIGASKPSTKQESPLSRKNQHIKYNTQHTICNTKLESTAKGGKDILEREIEHRIYSSKAMRKKPKKEGGKYKNSLALLVCRE